MVNRRFGKQLKPKPKRTSGFVYKPRSVESIKRRAERTGGRYDSPFAGGFDSFRPEMGDNVVRILPPTWDEEKHEDYGYTVWMHSWVGVDKGTYLCLNKNKMRKPNGEWSTMNKRCPICIAAKRAFDEGDEEDGRQLQATEKIVCWIINRKARDNKPILWSMSWSMDREINAQCYDKRHPERALLIDHPDDGFDLSFQRTGVQLNTRYIGVRLDREPSAISDNQKVQDEILKFIGEHPIPSILLYQDEEKLMSVMEGTAEATDKELDQDEEEEEEERPRLKSRRHDEEEEEEERKPKLKPKLKARGDEEDEEDDDEDDDEEGQTSEDDDEDENGEGDEDADQEESDDDEEEEAEATSNGAGDDDEGEEEEEERPALRRKPVERRPQLRARRGR